MARADNKPTDNIRWGVGSGGSVTPDRIEEPSSQKKTQAWLPKEKPNSKWFNWLFSELARWVNYLSASLESRWARGFVNNDLTRVNIVNRTGDLSVTKGTGDTIDVAAGKAWSVEGGFKEHNAFTSEAIPAEPASGESRMDLVVLDTDGTITFIQGTAVPTADIEVDDPTTWPEMPARTAAGQAELARIYREEGASFADTDIIEGRSRGDFRGGRVVIDHTAEIGKYANGDPLISVDRNYEDKPYLNVGKGAMEFIGSDTALGANGALVINAARTRYTSPVAQHTGIPGSAFRVLRDELDTLPILTMSAKPADPTTLAWDGSDSDSGAIVSSALSPALIAPLQLPVGAVITEGRLRCLNDTGRTIVWQIKSLGSGGPSVISSGGTTSSSAQTVTGSGPSTVDEPVVYVIIYFTGTISTGAGHSVEIEYFEIDYEMPRPIVSA